MQRLLCRGTSNHDAWIIDKNNRFDSFRRTIPLLYICYRLFNTEILYFENKNSKDFIDLNIHCSQRMHSTNKIRTIFTFIQWVTLKEKEISKLFTSLLNYLFIPCAPRDNAKSQFTNCGGETSTRDKQFPRNCRPERERERVKDGLIGVGGGVDQSSLTSIRASFVLARCRTAIYLGTSCLYYRNSLVAHERRATIIRLWRH